MEEELCTENHKNSHIYITEGYSKAGSPAGERWNEKSAEAEKKIDRREAKEIQEFRENCRRQTEKNRQDHEKNRTIYENSIRRMTEKLRLELDTRLDDVPLRARREKSVPVRYGEHCIWRIQESLKKEKRCQMQGSP